VRYEFQNKINVIDLGLRLKDVAKWKLPSEKVYFKGLVPSTATEKERDFLRSNRRVELNAFRPADFIAWIEAKLKEHGIKKVIPDAAVLEQAYRRSIQAVLVNAQLQELMDQAQETVTEITIPKNIATKVRKALAGNTAQPWDQAVAGMAEEWVEKNQD